VNRDSSAYANGNDLDSFAGTSVAVEALVLAMEQGCGILGSPWNRKLVALAGIAKIGGACDLGAGHVFAGLLFEATKLGFHICAAEHAGAVIADIIRKYHPQRGQ
jgi:hypothetical protein